MNELPLHFDPESHTYTVGGVEIPSVTEVCAPLTAGKYVPSGVVDHAAARGTRVHELCALFDMDALPDEIETECLPYLAAWQRFCRDYRPEWEYIEHPMHAGVNGLEVAGTVDRIGLIDGKRMVVDIKTAQSMDRASKVALCCQLEAYSHLAFQNGIEVLETGMGVQLMRDGSYRIQEQRKIEQKYRFDSYLLFSQLRNIHFIVKGK